MGFLSFLGFGNSTIRDALRKGAVLIDVRTAIEYDTGKVPDSINIPLDRIAVNIPRIRQMNRPVICCCASGARSSQAVNILKQNGLKEVYNGGSWMRMLKIAKSM